MRSITVSGLLAVGLAAGWHVAPAVHAQTATTLELTGLADGTLIDIAINGGKVADATANSQGDATSVLDLTGVLDLANAGKQRIYVYVDICENGKTVTVQLVIEGNEPPPEDDDCDRKPAGWFWSDADRVVIDAAAGTVSTPGGLLQSPWFYGGAGAGVGGLLFGLSGGGDSGSPSPPIVIDPVTPGPPAVDPIPPPPGFDPAGPWNCMSAFSSGDRSHVGPIDLAEVFQMDLSLQGTTMTAVGPPGSNFPTVMGPWDANNRRAVLTGNGTVAGFPNIGSRFEPMFPQDNTMQGPFTTGLGGGFPGGTTTTYNLTCNR